ncbi:MAG TPA: NAD(P)H-dependent oxidoreductase subunit E [Anaerolineales bacterium]|nr:NAD(P)H-dependent oxidoreductase subunit E [Anaerolineales bacterium]
MEQELQETDLVGLVDRLVQEHGAKRDAIIPILSEINRVFGYIPSAALPEIRRRIQSPQEGLFLADSHLYSAASFYQMFSLRPIGAHIVRFCESAPCHVMGGREVLKALQQELGLQPGETSKDMRWSLFMTSCLGICSVGPVFLVDDDMYGNVTPERVPEILARYQLQSPERSGDDESR